MPLSTRYSTCSIARSAGILSRFMARLLTRHPQNRQSEAQVLETSMGAIGTTQLPKRFSLTLLAATVMACATSAESSDNNVLRRIATSESERGSPAFERI